MKAPESLPKHIAIIMDGNGRWAQERGMDRIEGHREGVKRVLEISRACRDLGVPTLTLYAFSSENWRRPPTEVSALMVIMKEFLQANRQELIDTETRLCTIGDIDRLPAETLGEIRKTVDETRHLTRHTLNIALSYGGRDEILQATRKLAADVVAGRIQPDEISEELFAAQLDTGGQPDPDLMIRTSGEQRISNFLLWQLAYAEFIFPTVPWPDFTRDRLEECLDIYAGRERRFGMTGSQIKGGVTDDFA